MLREFPRKRAFMSAESANTMQRMERSSGTDLSPVSESMTVGY